MKVSPLLARLHQPYRIQYTLRRRHAQRQSQLVRRDTERRQKLFAEDLSRSNRWQPIVVSHTRMHFADDNRGSRPFPPRLRADEADPSQSNPPGVKRPRPPPGGGQSPPAGRAPVRSRSEGTLTTITARRKYSSSRNLPTATDSCSLRFVAVKTRASLGISCLPPTLWNVFSWRKRRRFTSTGAGSSPIFSRERAPRGRLDMPAALPLNIPRAAL